MWIQVLLGAALTILALGFALAPLWRRGAPDAAPRAAHEAATLKSALDEIDRDQERGAMDAAEAETARREVARRLIAADAAARASGALARAPRRVALPLAMALFSAAALGAVLLYAALGAPGLPDQPFSGRDLMDERRTALLDQATAEAAHRIATGPPPTLDAESAALLLRVETAVAESPEDQEGRRLLAQTYLRLNRPDRAWPYLLELAELTPAPETAAFRLRAARAMTEAAGGYVSQEARALFAQSPEAPMARFFLGLAALQSDDRDGAADALAIWGALYRSAPDAPSAPALRARMADIAAAIRATPEAMLARLGGPPSGLLGAILTRDGAAAFAAAEDAAQWSRVIRQRRWLGQIETARAIAALAERRAARAAPLSPEFALRLRRAAEAPLLADPAGGP